MELVSDTTLAVKRANHGPRGGKGSGRAWATRRRSWLAPLLAVAGTLVLASVLSPGLRSDLGALADFLGNMDAAGVKDWILSFGAFSPVAYFLVVVAQVIVNPIPAGPVTLAGALVFGVWEGLALSMAGSVVGSVVVFAAVRRWGKPLLLRFMDERTYLRYSGKLGEGGWWFFLIMLVPLMPDDAVCALAGLSAMSLRRYVAFMVVGRLPGATLTALLASDTITGSTAGWITAGLVLAAVLALSVVYRERLESWVLRRAGEAPVDPEARELDEGSRFTLCQPDPLADLFRRAGLHNVEVRAIDVPTVFRDFDDYWSPFLAGQVPAPAYAMSLSQERRTALRDRIRTSLPTNTKGEHHLTARAWAVRGVR
jgi:uncharacterized membrane protein YdjX (TVP38/TMEM64 family)